MSSSLEESFVAKEDLSSDNSVYDIWLNEPQSVKVRRQSFLRGIGLAQLASKSEEVVDLDRTSDCNEVVSSSSALCTHWKETTFVSSGRERNSEASSMIHEMEQEQFDKLDLAFQNENSVSPSSMLESEHSHIEEYKNVYQGKQKMKSWWKFLVHNKRKRTEGTRLSKISKMNSEAARTNRMKVKQNKKKCMEFTCVYKGQELQAHKGFIWTMKFSSDGQFLATGGEDGIVRIWRVTSVDASHKSFASEGSSKESKTNLNRKKMSQASIIIPKKIFQIEESPVHEFYGHASDVLDLAWSNSNSLLSSSEDKTVHLWQVGCSHCLNVFRHTNCVTCIQFNPVDENYFISGSIDGKVRIWGVSEKHVVNWVDARDLTSAICYRPDGKGFLVGSATGTCRIYTASGNDLQLVVEINVQGRKKTLGNRITGIQFCQERSQRFMISSEDSKLRIFDGFDIVHQFKGLSNSGSQMSASFTSTGRHIISVGEDCRVYVWNYDGSCNPSSKHIKSERSCEYLFSEGVSVAVPWSGMRTEPKSLLGCGSIQNRIQTEDLASWRRDPEGFSLGNWFSMDGSCRGGSATWPEERLPHWNVTVAEERHNLQRQPSNSDDHSALSHVWGLVIVTAGWDGRVRTFHNFGLPVRP